MDPGGRMTARVRALSTVAERLDRSEAHATAARWIAAGVLATAGAGVLAAVTAAERPDVALAGDARARAAELAVGWLLAVAGAVLAARTDERRVGWLLIASSCGWFVAELDSPAAPGAVAFTLGVVLSTAAPAVMTHAIHAALPRRPIRLDQALVCAAYAACVGVLGLAAAVSFDPEAEGCTDCPRNLVRLWSAPAERADLLRAGLHMSAAVLVLACVVWCWRLWRASPAQRRALAPVVLPACSYLGIAAAAQAHAWSRGFLSNDAIDRKLWLAQCIALALTAGGVGWQRFAARRTRAAIARLVVGLAGSPRPGALGALLAITLRDPSLELLHRSEIVGGWIDAEGRRRVLETATDRAVTTLVHGGTVVAALVHRPGLLDPPRLVEEIQRAGRLVLAHERLQAELRAQLEHLRASRVRIVAVGDAERHRLERDLHDGAQQGLVRLAWALGLARAQAEPVRAARLGQAQAEVQAALAELRSLAHGIFPAVLHDRGLAAAIRGLAEWTPLIVVNGLPDERFDTVVETTAYFMVAALAGRDGATVHITKSDGRLIVQVVSPMTDPDVVAEVTDRVGALDGSLRVERTAHGTQVTAEVPCA
jgi:signal transduction histidine kinase